jgi:hypothetical protein
MTSSFRLKAREALRLNRAPELLALLQWLLTFSLVTVAWIAFRAPDISTSLYIATHLFSHWQFNSFTLALGGIPRANTPFLILFIGAMFLVEWWMMHPHRAPKVWSCSAVRWTGYYACVYSIVFFGVFGHIDFIYFQF